MYKDIYGSIVFSKKKCVGLKTIKISSIENYEYIHTMEHNSAKDEFDIYRH